MPSIPSVVIYPDGANAGTIELVRTATLCFDRVYVAGMLADNPDASGAAGWRLPQRVEGLNVLARYFAQVLDTTKALQPLIQAGAVVSVMADDNSWGIIQRQAVDGFSKGSFTGTNRSVFDALRASLQAVGTNFGDLQLWSGVLSDLVKGKPMDVSDEFVRTLLVPDPGDLEILRVLGHSVALTSVSCAAQRYGASPATCLPEARQALHKLVEVGSALETTTGSAPQHDSVVLASVSRAMPVLSGLPPDELLELRERLRPGLVEFHRVIASIVAADGHPPSAVEYQRWADDVCARSIDPALRELEATVDTFQLRLVRKLASEVRNNVARISVPVVASVIGGVRLDVAAAAGLAVVLGTSLIEAKAEMAEDVRKHPLSWLFQLRKATRAV